MKDVNWSNEKNNWLKNERGISFENIKHYIENEEYVDILEHPNKEKYPNQRMFVMGRKGGRKGDRRDFSNPQ